MIQQKECWFGTISKKSTYQRRNRLWHNTGALHWVNALSVYRGFYHSPSSPFLPPPSGEVCFLLLCRISTVVPVAPWLPGDSEQWGKKKGLFLCWLHIGRHVSFVPLCVMVSSLFFRLVLSVLPISPRPADSDPEAPQKGPENGGGRGGHEG